MTALGLLLAGLPVLARVIDHAFIALFDTFFRVGSLVFGGGHVVLPLLEQEVVPPGLLTGSEFLSGYGMAQAVPGPLFTFAGYLGAMIHGIAGAAVATIAIFLPSFLLIIGVLPFFEALRKRPTFRGALTGVNAGVVGLLLAAFYDPVFTSGITNGADFALAAILFAMLSVWRLPAWVVVIAGVVLGSGMTLLLG
ncbi:putative uncharacterized transporter [Lentibacillus sp. JNUCC-1]|nr:putative uncharacterized transporter [Lentibacillus sp. JNUCC-1]